MRHLSMDAARRAIRPKLETQPFEVKRMFMPRQSGIVDIAAQWRLGGQAGAKQQGEGGEEECEQGG